MTGYLTKEEINNWTAEEQFLFEFHLLLTSQPYFSKRSEDSLKKLDLKMKALLKEFLENKDRTGSEIMGYSLGKLSLK